VNGQYIAGHGATAFQFNAGGFCGCLQVAGTDFNTAVGTRQHIHQSFTSCALCDIAHMASGAPGGIGGR
jgi:hypothetical protein